MPELWMPGAERQPQTNGGSMTGGPARAAWHITWDALNKGAQPKFDNVATYLKNAGYAPHLMWDPWTGRIVQFYPANQSSRALSNTPGGVETNRMGSVCIQVEIFFSPGAIRDGVTYRTVADTPCKGLAEIVSWLRSWGVADGWPSGWPEWNGNVRSATNWRRSGHFGHSQVPENNHTDPGPMPRGMFNEEDDVALTDADKKWISDAVADAVWRRDELPAPTGDPSNPKWKGQSHLQEIGKSLIVIKGQLATLLSRSAGGDGAPVVQNVQTSLSPADIASVARQVAEEISVRMKA